MKGTEYARLIAAIEAVTREATGRAVTAVNRALVVRNWMVGAYIVEYQQRGSDRAEYGARLLDRLAKDLKVRRVRGLDPRTLRDCRLLYHCYPQIRATVSLEFRRSRRNAAAHDPVEARRALRSGAQARGTPVGAASTDMVLARHASSPSAQFDGIQGRTGIRGSVTPESVPGPQPLAPTRVLQFSWTHLIALIGIDDPWKRAFYENHCLEGAWSVRQLQRQIESLLYERTGLSKNKHAVIRAAHVRAAQQRIEDLIRDPYVLEFTGLANRSEYSESELETALLDHLQRFLLELGTGFCFEARQFRITVNGKHDRVDLVFYHRRLRCHVLLELKIRGFRHADAGQMNFYVNWFRSRMKTEGDNPPVGIILCSAKDRTEVEFATAGMDNRLFVSRYVTALPSVEELKSLIEEDRARLEGVTAPRNRRTK